MPTFFKPSFIIFGSRNQIPVPKWKKKKKWEKNFWITRRGNKGSTNRGRDFKDCKAGQEGLQIAEAVGISNRG